MYQAFVEEEGSQLIEYIAVLPFIMVVVLIGWQFFLVGHTFIVTANAAREGVRAAVVCNNGGFFDVREAASNSVPEWYRSRMLVSPPSVSGREVTVQVVNFIPVIDIFSNYQEFMPPVTFKAVMREERCPT